MCRNALTIIAVVVLCCCTWTARAADDAKAGADAAPRTVGPWTLLAKHDDATLARDPWIRPSKGQALKLDVERMREMLKGAPMEFTEEARTKLLILELPDPNGSMQRFSVWESPVLSAPLAAQNPRIKTYVGQGLDDRACIFRGDITEQGFHAQVLAPNDASWYIDPCSRDDRSHLNSYYRRDLKRSGNWSCTVHNTQTGFTTRGGVGLIQPLPHAPIGATRTTIRLAVGCTHEYTNFHGGTEALATSAITTAVHRINGVFERDLSTRFILVGTKVCLDAGAGCYTGTTASALRLQNPGVLNAAIGSPAYDIGHVFAMNSDGGLATLGGVCQDSCKAQGATGISLSGGGPTGDPFWIDYVAHEIGHQCAATHTFNSVGQGTCTIATREGATAFEPGSGSTIMGYAGNCDSDNVLSQSSDYFHSASIDQMSQFLSAICPPTASCGVTCQAVPGRVPPTVMAAPLLHGPLSIVIPVDTPFELSIAPPPASPDIWTYCWEQRDSGSGASLTTPDDGFMPLNISGGPIAFGNQSLDGYRSVPSLERVLLGSPASLVDRLPSVGRTYRWRVTVRDNVAGGGGVAHDDVVIYPDASARNFHIVAPNSATTWTAGEQKQVTWDTANTGQNQSSGVSCESVQILFSANRGATFPYVLASNTPNTGSAMVTVPWVATNEGRIKVKAIGNIFYDINDANITVDFGRITMDAGYSAMFRFQGGGFGNYTLFQASDYQELETPVQVGDQTFTYDVRTDAAPGTYDGWTGGTATFVPYARASRGVLKAYAACQHVSLQPPPNSVFYDYTHAFCTSWVNATDRIRVSGPATRDRVWVAYRVRTVSDVQASLSNGPQAVVDASAVASYSFGPSSEVRGDVLAGQGRSYRQVRDLPPVIVASSEIVAGSLSVRNGAVIWMQSALTANCNGNSYSAVANSRNSSFVELFIVDPGVTLTSASGHDYSPPPCAPPAVGLQPVSVDACVSGAASFSMAGQGDGPFLYRWKFLTSDGQYRVILDDGVVVDPLTGAGFTAANTSTGTIALSGFYSGSGATLVDSFTLVGEVITACGVAQTSSATARFSVPSIGSIVSQPANAWACPGGAASFTLAVQGGMPSYQWRMNGSPIPGATSATLSLASVSATDAGAYDCIVSRSCTSVTSAAATLAVTSSAVITQHSPALASVCGPIAVNLTVTTLGPNVAYQWMDSIGPIAGANGPSHTVELTSDGSYSYSCVVTDSCGTDSITFTREVRHAPTVTQQPPHQTWCVGGDPHTFTVVATGTAPLSYQWRRNGQVISGATGSTYIVPPPTVAGDSWYECGVENVCGSWYSFTAVNVQAAGPTITQQPGAATACAGNGATFAVAGTGVAPLAYRWQWRVGTAGLWQDLFDGVRAGGTTVAGASTPGLSLSEISESDFVPESVFACRVSDACGAFAVSGSAGLTTLPGQPFSARSTSGWACPYAVFFAEGTPAESGPFTYQWYRNGVAIVEGPTGNGSTFSLPDPQVLVLFDAAAADAGDYTCTVTNACRSITPPAQPLLFEEPVPTIDTQPMPTTICPRGTATLTVGASAAGHYEYFWQVEDPTQPDGWAWLADGPLVIGGQMCGTVAGTETATLTYVPIGAQPACSRTLRFRGEVDVPCNYANSNSAQVTICPPDFNCSGSPNVQDIFDFLSAWFANSPLADFNGSGTSNIQDIFDFLAAWFAGC